MATAKRVPIASGRACDVYSHGDGRVLRRYREGEPCDTAREAEMMRLAERADVPVPHVHEVQPDALVMDRVDAPTMLAEIERQPWRFEKHARDLGLLHRRVLDAGLNHGDFHPLNILLAESGPVVIDWSNAGEGPPERDVAFTHVILATSDTDFPRWLEWIGRAVRRRFVRAYLRGVGLQPSPAELHQAAERRLGDPHLRERELAQVREFRTRC